MIRGVISLNIIHQFTLAMTKSWFSLRYERIASKGKKAPVTIDEIRTRIFRIQSINFDQSAIKLYVLRYNIHLFQLLELLIIVLDI